MRRVVVAPASLAKLKHYRGLSGDYLAPPDRWDWNTCTHKNVGG